MDIREANEKFREPQPRRAEREFRRGGWQLRRGDREGCCRQDKTIGDIHHSKEEDTYPST